jgi:D-amino peptidase
MTKVLIISDIEGSTGCQTVAASKLFTKEWAKACYQLTLDINSVCKSLWEAGAKEITVKDFHRTGFNIFPEMLDPKVRLVQGYFPGPVLGIGQTYGAEKLFMIGMHSSSGANGFIPHTLTSKFASIKINNQSLTEAELFSSSVYKNKISPVFFSGCEVACKEASSRIPGLETFVVKKPTDQIGKVRLELAKSAAHALLKNDSQPFTLQGPFSVKITMRDGAKTAEKLKKRWNLSGEKDQINFHVETADELYRQLTSIAYMRPWLSNYENLALKVFNLWGKATLNYARKFAK